MSDRIQTTKDFYQAFATGDRSFVEEHMTDDFAFSAPPDPFLDRAGYFERCWPGAGKGQTFEFIRLIESGNEVIGGTCPPVGIAGLTLGGGLGIFGRKYGGTSDRLIRAQIVLADGRVIDCDESHHEDLFWALRGAGSGNFGVVTALAFRPVPVPDVTNFHLAWPYPHVASAIEAWQRWAPNGPDELAASLKVTTTEEAEQPPSVDVYGALSGDAFDATGLLDELVVRSGSDPTSAFVKRMTFPETRRFWANLGAAEAMAGEDLQPQAAQHPYLISKSEFFRRPLLSEAILALVENFSLGRVPGESRELDFMPWGGAYNRVRPEATAFVHRGELFQLKHAATVDPQGSIGEKDRARGWVIRSWASVHPWGSGQVFQNFIDPDLEGWADAYYGTNYERLVRVKARYDPTGFFRFHQSLPVR
jgi:FAD/FMN-containing dehydrogenase